MTFDEMTKAVNDASNQLAIVDRVAARLASMLVGRLRQCNSWTLKKLKMELRDFNAHTNTWAR